MFFGVCVSENGYARHMAVSIWKMMRIDHQMLGQPGNAITTRIVCKRKIIFPLHAQVLILETY